MNKVYVYGTLRPGRKESVLVPGQMFDLGWFPGVVNIETAVNTFFKAEIIEVDDETLARLDSYEGYNPNNPENSLYIRKEYKGGFIYQYNGDVGGKLPVPTDPQGCSDWLEYTQMKEGSNASYITRW